MAPYVAVAALWILLGSVSLATAAKPRVPKTELSHPCSRASSRTVRQRYLKEVERRLNRAGQTSPLRNWPDGCPFSPLVDIFGWHEKNKSRLPKSAMWVCNYTGKVFKNEHYIDLHMETHYMQESPESGVCLADYCGIFGLCSGVTEPTFFESLSAEPPPCDAMALEAQKHTCHSVCDRCTLFDGPSNVNAGLHRLWCDPLTCEVRAERHYSNRKWCFVGVFGAVFLVCIWLYCVCAPSDESEKRKYSSDRRNRNAGKRFPSGSREQQPPTHIVDIMPDKVLKQE